jgi:hypothetical protein
VRLPRFGRKGGRKSPEDGKSTPKRKRARLRRRRGLARLIPPRPRLPQRVPRPKLPGDCKLPRPKLPFPDRRARMRSRLGEVWFRFRTRLQAIRYWLREKLQALWRRLRAEASGIAFWWSRRSRLFKGQVAAVLGVFVLYLVVKFISIPGVPCEISAAKECAPANQTIAYVPRDAALYAHVTVNSDSHQWELAEDLRSELPNVTALLRSLTGAVTAPGSRQIDLPREVLPWAKDDLSLIGVPGPGTKVPEAYVVGVGDEKKADQFLASLSPGGASKQTKVNGGTLTTYSNGLATERVDDVALFGSLVAVHAALDAKAGRAPELDGSDQAAALDELPDVRLAEIYLSRAGVDRLLAGRQGGATQLDTFVDYGAMTGMAASLRARDDGIEIQLDSRLDPKLEQQNPTVFADLPKFEPSLADEAGARALGYVGVGELGPALNRALATAAAGGQGLAGSLRALSKRLQKEAGVDPLRDLLPALGGQAALVAEPTEGVPYASLIVEGVDTKKATAALAALQGPLARSVSSGARVPDFQTKDVDGVTVHSLSISPQVNLSYAVFDRLLVISTQPEGIEQVRSNGDELADTGSYQAALEHLPSSVSALVFLNLDEVFGLAQQAGLATDPLYASLSEDISRIGSLGLAVTGSSSELRSELFLATND